jgi:hypothetical protein
MAIGTLAAIGLGAAGIGSFLGAKSNKKAAQYAADTSLATAQSNNALARDIYGKNQAALQPYMTTGHMAAVQMNALLGLGTPAQANEARNDFRNWIANSDYGFQFGQGANRVNSGFAGAGTLQSGAAMKELEQFRQNLQSGYRGEYNSLIANQQGLGLGAASALAGVGQNYTNTVTANNNNAASAAANAALVKAQNNPFANTLSLLGGGVFGLGS